MPRLPKKRWKYEARITRKAELEAEAKFRRSPLGMESAVLKMLDRVDPLELLAVIASTFVVYDIIKSTPEMLAQAKSMLFTPPIAYAMPIVTIIINAIFGDQSLTEEQKVQFAKIRDEPDFILFVKSFAIAYVLVKHSGQIISGVGNVAGYIAGYMGLKVV